MSALIAKITIINDGLQQLGQPSIANINENSTGAKAMLRAYDMCMLSELAKHNWKFAIKRASLAASAFPPEFGKSYRYPLPGDYLRLCPEETTYDNPRRKDWEIEGTDIMSDDAAPLEIRYVSSATPESNFHVLFAKSLSCSLAEATCEQLTNSNTKIETIQSRYLDNIRQAKKCNAIESAPVKSPTCSWISVRS